MHQSQRLEKNASKIEITKKILDIENFFKYDLRIFMHKFKRDILPSKFKPYFKNYYKITRFSEQTIYSQIK